MSTFHLSHALGMCTPRLLSQVIRADSVRVCVESKSQSKSKPIFKLDDVSKTICSTKSIAPSVDITGVTFFFFYLIRCAKLVFIHVSLFLNHHSMSLQFISG